MDFKSIQKQIDQLMADQNNQPVPDFEGYSPDEMHHILHTTFEKNSPITLNKLSDSDYRRIPILNMVRYLAELIEKAGEIKLTKTGNLPIKIVAELYQQGFIKEDHVEQGITKLYIETDSMAIHLTKILLLISGMAKKRNGKLSLTKSGSKILADDHELWVLILTTYTQKFNWSYFDGYEENQVGKLGYGFTLILLSKYGNERRSDSFYAEKYFNAFPMLLNQVQPTYGTFNNYATDCYSLRTFQITFNFLGLVKIEEEGTYINRITYVSKSDLFDRLIKVELP